MVFDNLMLEKRIFTNVSGEKPTTENFAFKLESRSINNNSVLICRFQMNFQPILRPPRLSPKFWLLVCIFYHVFISSTRSTIFRSEKLQREFPPYKWQYYHQLPPISHSSASWLSHPLAHVPKARILQ